MATQAEIAQGIADATAQLQAVAAQVAKVGSETAVTLQKVADLEVVIASLGGTVDPALQTAFDALKTQVQRVADATAAVKQRSPGELEAFKATIRSIGKATAEAAKEGGIFGIGGTLVSDDEKTALAQIEAAMA